MIKIKYYCNGLPICTPTHFKQFQGNHCLFFFSIPNQVSCFSFRTSFPLDCDGEMANAIISRYSAR